MRIFKKTYGSGVISATIPVVVLTALLFVFNCEKNIESQTEKSEVTSQKSEVEKKTSKIITASHTEPFARLANIRAVAEGNYAAPVISPTGDKIAFSTEGFKGLFIAPIEGGKVTQLTSEPRAGYLPVWDGDGVKIGYRTPAQVASDVPFAAVDIEGKKAPPFSVHEEMWVMQKEERIILRVDDKERTISGDGDKYFAPIISGDEKFIAYNGLKSGIYLYRVEDGVTVQIGRGNHPAFCDDGSLLFDRTEDDGEKETGGELYITDLKAQKFNTAPLTATADLIEKFPSCAKGKIAFSAGGKIYVADIERF
ncbi:MAG: hypothetical protein Kow0090_10000 [Myxococcota bacterium]